MLCVLLYVEHLSLHIRQTILLNQLFHKHYASVICSDLCLEVRDVVGQVPSAPDQWVSPCLIVHYLCYLSLLELSISHYLEAFNGSSFFLEEFGEAGHAPRLDAANVSVMASACHKEDGFARVVDRRDDGHVGKMSSTCHRMISQDHFTLLPVAS